LGNTGVLTHFVVLDENINIFLKKIVQNNTEYKKYIHKK